MYAKNFLRRNISIYCFESSHKKNSVFLYTVGSFLKDLGHPQRFQKNKETGTAY